ncbi:hypothetical protein HRbin36_01297 [bacterium HR36]|nr:hypothetical protein HRbin36_01297 [bacterium HR36]
MKLRVLFRGLLVILLAGMAWFAWRMWRWADPETWRQATLEALAARFPDATISLERAQLQGFGQLVIEQLRLYPRDISGNPTMLEIGRGVVILDRLALAHGQVIPKMLILQQCELRLRRTGDAQWQYPPIVSQCGIQNGGLAVVRIEQARVHVEDEVQGERVSWQVEEGEVTREGEKGWHFRARGALSWGGALAVEGTVTPAAHDNRGGIVGDWFFKWQLNDVPLQSQWQQRLARWTGLTDLQNWQASGWFSVHGEWASGNSEQWPPLELELREVKLQHPQLPEPIYGLRGSIHLQPENVAVLALQGQWLGATLTLAGTWQGLDAQGNGEIEAQLQPLQVDPRLYDKLPAALAKVCREFSPEGPVHLTLRWRRQAAESHLHITAALQGLSFAFEDFPYPIRQATGHLTYTEAPSAMPLLRVDITGLASGRKVQLRGEAFGPGLRPEVPWRSGLRLDLESENVPINETLLKALPPRTQWLAREFRPQGLVRVHATIRRNVGTPEQPVPPILTHIEARISQGQVCYKRLPYPLEQVQGLLEIDLPAETWRAVGFSGRHKDGLVFMTGQGEPTPRGEKVSLVLQGQQILLDQELHAALPEKVQRAWEEIAPAGRADFIARLDWVGEQSPQLDLTLTARGQCSVQPRFFPYKLEELKGSARYHNGQIVLGTFAARHGESRIFLGREQLGGVLRLPGDGSWHLELYQVRGDLLHLDRDLLAALPEGLRAALETLQPDRPLRVIFDLQADNPRGYQVQSIRWNGHASFARCTWQCGIPLREATGYVALQGSWQAGRVEALGNVQLQEVSVFRLPLREVAAEIQIRDGSVFLPGVRAKLFDGQVFGPIRYDYHPRPSFSLDLTVAQVDLQSLARQSLGRQGKAQGKIQARFILAGQPHDWRTLTGKGSLDITDGHIYDVPPLLNLLGLLVGQLPRDAAFQEVQVRYQVEGPRVHFSRVELLGDALTLRGQGSMRIDGSDLDLEMYALLWGRSLPLLPPGIDRVPPLISRQLWKIRMRGSLHQVVVTREPMPLVTDTLRLIWQLGPGRLQDAKD